MDLIEELVRIYETEETHHTKKLSYEEARAYFDVCVGRGRILTRIDSFGQIQGYVESWRINYEQFGRILCRLPFNIKEEDIERGNICYVEGTWIDPRFRGFKSVVFTQLVGEFFKQNFQCEFFVGEAMRKASQPLKVMKRTEAIMKYLREDLVHGKG